MGRNGKAALARAACRRLNRSWSSFWSSRHEPGGGEPAAQRLRAQGTPMAGQFLCHNCRSVRRACFARHRRPSQFRPEDIGRTPGIVAAREQKGHPAGRVLEAWHSDPKYLDSSGKPRDLSEKDQEPSFHTLVLEHLPGVTRHGSGRTASRRVGSAAVRASAARAQSLLPHAGYQSRQYQ